VLGAAVANGIPAHALLRAATLERQALLAIAAEAATWNVERDKSLARLVVIELAGAMKRAR
jgi:hypothetical protein